MKACKDKQIEGIYWDERLPPQPKPPSVRNALANWSGSGAFLFHSQYNIEDEKLSNLYINIAFILLTRHLPH